MKRKTSSDVYDINHKTGALVIGKNRLDDYATKFLNKYCKEKNGDSLFSVFFFAPEARRI